MAGEPSSCSFVARLWLEYGHDGKPRWRGHIKHVQGDEEGYVQDFGQMSEFLERISGVPGPRGESGLNVSAPSESGLDIGGKRKQ